MQSSVRDSIVLFVVGVVHIQRNPPRPHGSPGSRQPAVLKKVLAAKDPRVLILIADS